MISPLLAQNDEVKDSEEKTIAERASEAYELVRAFPVKGQQLSTDFIKSAYVANDKNQVLKFD